MRVIRDGFGTVTATDGTVYTNVRFLVDDKRRVAVFDAKAPPVAVFADGEATFTVLRKPCACKGDPPRLTFQRLWQESERVTA